MTLKDLERIKNNKTIKEHRLDNLAKACADATSDDMKTMWFEKLKKLAEKYNMMDYFRKLIH